MLTTQQIACVVSFVFSQYISFDVVFDDQPVSLDQVNQFDMIGEDWTYLPSHEWDGMTHFGRGVLARSDQRENLGNFVLDGFQQPFHLPQYEETLIDAPSYYHRGLVSAQNNDCSIPLRAFIVERKGVSFFR